MTADEIEERIRLAYAMGNFGQVNRLKVIKHLMYLQSLCKEATK
jgi:hypothetical protein